MDKDFTDGHINQQNIDANVDFDQQLAHIASMTDKMDELQQMFSTGRKSSKVRTFGEILTTADFEERCLNHNKGCAIGILPAMTIIDYEEENFNQHISVLKELDEEAKATPIYYSWVNITCHPEWLKFFEVDPFQVPTVVYYYPEKQL